MDPHLAKLFLILVTIGFAMGFASGYGIRAGISHYRRATARRNRMLIE
jgi:NhaP-type Na+/H+ or K+/H+ antiporter